jgi:hypothetical protein
MLSRMESARGKCNTSYMYIGIFAERQISGSNIYYFHWTLDSSVGIVTGFGFHDWASTAAEARDFLPSTGRLWGPPSLLANGYRGLCTGVQRTRREADDHFHYRSRLQSLGTPSSALCVLTDSVRELTGVLTSWGNYTDS